MSLFRLVPSLFRCTRYVLLQRGSFVLAFFRLAEQD